MMFDNQKMVKMVQYLRTRTISDVNNNCLRYEVNTAHIYTCVCVCVCVFCVAVRCFAMWRSVPAIALRSLFLNWFVFARLQRRFGDGAVIELSVDDGMLHISGRDASICQTGFFSKWFWNVHDASVQDRMPSFSAPHFSLSFFSRALSVSRSQSSVSSSPVH